MATISHAPDSQPPDSLRAEVANLRQQVAYLADVIVAMCREAGVGHLLAVGENSPPRQARHLSVVR